jgi:hypothetical protein
MKRLSNICAILLATLSAFSSRFLELIFSSFFSGISKEWSSQQSAGILSSENVPEWPFLATFLISEASQGTNSRWHPYINALPCQPESILLW